MKEYFSHDYNARHDRKITALVKEYKSSGYGIFWATCELMHEEGDRLDYDEITFGAIAKDLNESEEFIQEVIDKCISKFRLFSKQESKLTSSRVKQNLSGREAKRSKKQAAGKLGGIKSGESRRSKQNEALLEANELNYIKLKESKVNNNKEDGEAKKKDLNKFPTVSSFNGLPEIKNIAAIELIRITQQVDVSKKDVDDLWEVFKIQNLNGNVFYENNERVYQHFINWSKTQNIKRIVVKEVFSPIKKEKDVDFEKYKSK